VGVEIELVHLDSDINELRALLRNRNLDPVEESYRSEASDLELWIPFFDSTGPEELTLFDPVPNIT